MKTKLVYVITSSLDDVYWEEGWVSAWSARYHNPEAHIVLVCDKDTLDTAEGSYRAKSLELFDEKITVDFNPETGNKQRSRWIKTNLREYVKGDFLFIDTDTVITDKLDEIDDWDIDIGMVYDLNRITPTPFHKKLFEKAYQQSLPIAEPYYNGGVIFAKDNERVQSFYHQWHQNWQKLEEKADYTDQTPLVRTNMELGYPISEISGNYNCQISCSIKYLYLAKIIHFYHVWWHNYSMISPFMDKNTYIRVKDKQGIDDSMQNLIINCKTEFEATSVPINEDLLLLLSSTTIRFVLLPLFVKKRSFYQHVDKFIHFLCRILYRLHIRL